MGNTVCFVLIIFIGSSKKMPLLQHLIHSYYNNESLTKPSQTIFSLTKLTKLISVRMQSTSIALSKQSRRSISISKGDFPISKGTFYAAPSTWIFSWVWILTVLDHHLFDNSAHAAGHIWTQFKIHLSAIGACITKLIYADKTSFILPKYYRSLQTHLWTWLMSLVLAAIQIQCQKQSYMHIILSYQIF